MRKLLIFSIVISLLFIGCSTEAPVLPEPEAEQSEHTEQAPAKEQPQVEEPEELQEPKAEIYRYLEDYLIFSPVGWDAQLLIPAAWEDTVTVLASSPDASIQVLRVVPNVLLEEPSYSRDFCIQMTGIPKEDYSGSQYEKGVEKNTALFLYEDSTYVYLLETSLLRISKDASMTMIEAMGQEPYMDTMSDFWLAADEAAKLFYFDGCIMAEKPEEQALVDSELVAFDSGSLYRYTGADSVIQPVGWDISLELPEEWNGKVTVLTSHPYGELRNYYVIPNVMLAAYMREYGRSALDRVYDYSIRLTGLPTDDSTDPPTSTAVMIHANTEFSYYLDTGHSRPLQCEENVIRENLMWEVESKKVAGMLYPTQDEAKKMFHAEGGLRIELEAIDAVTYAEAVQEIAKLLGNEEEVEDFAAYAEQHGLTRYMYGVEWEDPISYRDASVLLYHAAANDPEYLHMMIVTKNCPEIEGIHDGSDAYVANMYYWGILYGDAPENWFEYIPAEAFAEMLRRMQSPGLRLELLPDKLTQLWWKLDEVFYCTCASPSVYPAQTPDKEGFYALLSDWEGLQRALECSYWILERDGGIYYLNMFTGMEDGTIAYTQCSYNHSTQQGEILETRTLMPFEFSEPEILYSVCVTEDKKELLKNELLDGYRQQFNDGLETYPHLYQPFLEGYTIAFALPWRQDPGLILMNYNEEKLRAEMLGGNCGQMAHSWYHIYSSDLSGVLPAPNSILGKVLSMDFSELELGADKALLLDFLIVALTDESSLSEWDNLGDDWDRIYQFYDIKNTFLTFLEELEQDPDLKALFWHMEQWKINQKSGVRYSISGVDSDGREWDAYVIPGIGVDMEDYVTPSRKRLQTLSETGENSELVPDSVREEFVTFALRECWYGREVAGKYSTAQWIWHVSEEGDVLLEARHYPGGEAMEHHKRPYNIIYLKKSEGAVCLLNYVDQSNDLPDL